MNSPGNLFRLGCAALIAVTTGLAQAENTYGKDELPIHDAARMGTRADIEHILKSDPAMRDARTPNLGATPLHLAALNLDSGPLKALLAAGSRVNARNNDGMTPLHMAAFATRGEHAQLLLKAGANPLIKSNEGRDVASVARRVRADEVAGIVSLWILRGCNKSPESARQC
ncbi:MAG: ankyrin repeat domain-containing protein [Gammaproteobacteria bacterium]|nr:ankyrin repeat domain-containing protein [Rhodocyclaceae bacterium]MBU3910752.1 ankyrin repeat domain-containing protein [Gammaproteobacteria bacterium]MBU3988917.1 ankyrin repeat domain-containing protein [Gammaproteobacteria bacterium]MBU4003462.1 ankyrin repeat domain-containing protein [Gammaproteobacteria bacterium]MBU4021933.1 ankyrin repeat domain-containing protein [Gammaproteobacteria bacterium]